MKIAFVSDHYSTPDQPGILRTWQVAKHLAEQGDEVVVIAPAHHYLFAAESVPADSRATEQIRVVRMPTSSMRRDSTLSRVRQYAEQLVFSAIQTWRLGRFDVVVAGLTPSMLGIGAFCAAWLRRTPFVLDERDLALDAAEQVGLLPHVVLRAARRVERFVYARAAKVVTVTPGLHKLLIERGVPREKLILAPNGYEQLSVESPAAGRAAVREGLDWGTRTVLLYAGGLGPMYDLDIVLDALAHFDHERFLFVIMGEGDYKTRYEERAERDGLPVRFAPAVPKADLEAVCRAADVCVVPLRNLPRSQLVLSNKLFDYLGAGRPVLVTGPGDMADLVAEAGAGLAVPAQDPEAFAKALQSLVADPEAAERMGAAGRDYVLGSWTRSASVGKFRSALIEAVAPSAALINPLPEHERIRAVYHYYDSSDREQRKRDSSNSGVGLNAATRWSALRASLLSLGLPEGAQVLDVGCGSAGDLQRIAVEFESLHPSLNGIDLLAGRIEQARTALPEATLRVGGGEDLPYDDHQFDVVLVSTVFSSILDHGTARALAGEIQRVLAADGVILCYDVRCPNPGNPHTRSVRSRDLRRLFPGADIRLCRVTLLPPLARHLGRFTGSGYRALYQLEFLRTHYLAEIRNGTIPASHAEGTGGAAAPSGSRT